MLARRVPLQVVPWAQSQFLQEVSKPDESISLAKTCLVVALEEEAVAYLETAKGKARCGTSRWGSNGRAVRCDSNSLWARVLSTEVRAPLKEVITPGITTFRKRLSIGVLLKVLLWLPLITVAADASAGPQQRQVPGA